MRLTDENLWLCYKYDLSLPSCRTTPVLSVNLASLKSYQWREGSLQYHLPVYQSLKPFQQHFSIDNAICFWETGCQCLGSFLSHWFIVEDKMRTCHFFVFYLFPALKMGPHPLPPPAIRTVRLLRLVTQNSFVPQLNSWSSWTHAPWLDCKVVTVYVSLFVLPKSMDHQHMFTFPPGYGQFALGIFDENFDLRAGLPAEDNRETENRREREMASRQRYSARQPQGRHMPRRPGQRHEEVPTLEG